MNDVRISRLEEDLMFYRSFPEDFNPKNMSWDELLSRLIVAYKGCEALLENLEAIK